MVAATVIELDDRELRKQLTLLQRQGADLRPAMREIGEEWVGSIRRTFDVGGRPTKWKRKSTGEPAHLKDTRRLQRSMTYRASADDVAVGTNVRYARLMHFGGVVRPRRSKFLAIPLSSRRELQAGARAFIRRQPEGSVFMRFKSGGRGTIFVRRGEGIEAVFALRKKVEVPARPFLQALPSDIAEFRRIVVRHVLRGQS